MIINCERWLKNINSKNCNDEISIFQKNKKSWRIEMRFKSFNRRSELGDESRGNESWEEIDEKTIKVLLYGYFPASQLDEKIEMLKNGGECETLTAYFRGIKIDVDTSN